MQSIDPNELLAVTGGMQWQNFRRSNNVEDRRGPKAVARDNAWWASTHKEAK